MTSFKKQRKIQKGLLSFFKIEEGDGGWQKKEIHYVPYHMLERLKETFWGFKMENPRGGSSGMHLDISWPASSSVFHQSESVSILAWRMLGKDDVIQFWCEIRFLEVSLDATTELQFIQAVLQIRYCDC